MHLILFVDDFYYDMIQIISKNDSVMIVKLHIEDLHIYNMIMKNKQYIHLPCERSEEKDTHEYMALMNSKPEFLYRALLMIDTKYIAWIDAGVAKMFKNKDESFSRLCNYTVTNLKNILIPGCYITDLSMNELCHGVWWIFLGTFFICNRDIVSKFYGLSLSHLVEFLVHGHITWEVNVWANILDSNPEVFEWYYALHDDGFCILPEIYVNCH